MISSVAIIMQYCGWQKMYRNCVVKVEDTILNSHSVLGSYGFLQKYIHLHTYVNKYRWDTESREIQNLERQGP